MIQKLLHLATLLRCVHAPEHVCGGVKVLAHEQVWLSLHGELEVPGTVLHVTGRGRCGRKNLSWYAEIGVLVEWNCVRREQWWLRKYKRNTAYEYMVKLTIPLRPSVCKVRTFL